MPERLLRANHGRRVLGFVGKLVDGVDANTCTCTVPFSLYT